MAWVESHVEIGEHPKIFKLMELLDIDTQKAVGAAHLLWHFTMKYAWRDGNLERFSEMAVARGSKWEGDPKKFIEALQGAGFLEGLKVHDWTDCAGRLITDRLYNEKRRKTAQNAVNMELPNPTLPNPTLPNPTLPKEDISKDISSDVSTSNGHRPEYLKTVDLIWEEYITKLGKNPKILTLTNLRKNKGLARLAESLKKTKGNLEKAKSLMFIAIESLTNSDWHMGRDPKTGGKKYDSWENNLFRSSEQFEKWLEQSR